MQKLCTHQELKKARNETKAQRGFKEASQKPSFFPLENPDHKK